jgi:hypothetical protein
MQTHLVLIEGVPFSGKSTLSEYVAEQLTLNGAPAQWVHEGVMLRQHFTHVLAILERKEVLSPETLVANWAAFAQAVRESPTAFVVDGALTFAGLWPLLAADLPRSTITEVLGRIAALCEPLRPRVVHLTGDVDRIARESYAQRGPGWQEHSVRQSDSSLYQQTRGRSGTDGVTLFFQDAQALMETVLSEGGWRTLTLDVTAGDRCANLPAVLDFLGLREITPERPAIPPETLRSYGGRYLEETQDEEGEVLTVRLEKGGLALHGPSMRLGALAPITATRFHVTATMLDIEFVAEGGGVEGLVVFSAGKAYRYGRLAGDEDQAGL